MSCPATCSRMMVTCSDRVPPAFACHSPSISVTAPFAARGQMVFVGGMIGWDTQGVFQTDDFAAQARQALEHIVTVLREAGAKPEHLVRVTWYVTDKREYLAAGREVGRAWKELIGSYNAAMTAVEVKALIEDRAKVEIEATAVIPDPT